MQRDFNLYVNPHNPGDWLTTIGTTVNQNAFADSVQAGESSLAALAPIMYYGAPMTRVGVAPGAAFAASVIAILASKDYFTLNPEALTSETPPYEDYAKYWYLDSAFGMERDDEDDDDDDDERYQLVESPLEGVPSANLSPFLFPSLAFSLAANLNDSVAYTKSLAPALGAVMIVGGRTPKLFSELARGACFMQQDAVDHVAPNLAARELVLKLASVAGASDCVLQDDASCYGEGELVLLPEMAKFGRQTGAFK